MDGEDPSAGYPQEGTASDDSDSDEELGRADGSPVLGRGHDSKFQKLIKESKNLVSDISTMQQQQKDQKFQPKMTEVMEETEPESSFKETDKWQK